MKILLPGGSGQVGQVIAGHFHSQGNEVVVLSRDPQPAPWRTAHWDGHSLGAWQQELDGADVVIGLAGKNVNTRYSAENRRQIMDSRVEPTRTLGQAIAASRRPPRLWLQASTATIYAHSFGPPHDEDGQLGGGEPGAPAKWDFSVEVGKAWEQSTLAADTPQTRRVLLRSALIMNPAPGGIFDTLMTLVRFGLSGPPAGGRQYVSWVHDHDFVRILDFLIEREDIEGVVNVSSPNPLPYRDFTAALRRAYGMPIGLPATRWMLEIAAFLLRTETELILKSRRSIPGRLLGAGFSFDYPEWEAAAQDLVSRWRQLRA
jgi:uncharacterized protein (TIGR01777 family)